MSALNPAMIQRLTKLDFFRHVGASESIYVPDFGVALVQSWREAVQLRGSDEASDAFSEGRYQLTRRLSAEFRTEYRKLNQIAKRIADLIDMELLPNIEASIDDSAELRLVEYGMQLVKESVRWDLVHYMLEDAFSSYVSPGFYSKIIGVYEAGHFPCSWDEAWPEGQIWVY